MRGHLRKLARDSWTATFDLPRGVDGKRRQKRMTFHGTKREAEEALRRELARFEGGEEEPIVERRAAKISLAEFGRDLIESKRGSRSDDTLDTDLQRWNQRIVPVIGTIPLARVTDGHVEQCLAALRTAPRLDRKQGALSQRTVHHCYALLRNVLGAAVRRKMLRANPCDMVEPPSKGQTEVKALDLDGAIAVLHGLRGHDVYAPAVVAAYTGLRRGEILGWRWEDVDLEAGVATVQRSLSERRTRDEDGGLQHAVQTKALKTASSRRPVALPEAVVEALREHRVAQTATATVNRWRVAAQTHVFTDEHGLPIAPDVLSSAFYYEVRKRDLGTVSLKALRSTFASLHAEVGTPLVVASRAMGHSTIKTTADLYTRVPDRLQVEAARRLSTEIAKRTGGLRYKDVTKSEVEK